MFSWPSGAATFTLSNLVARCGRGPLTGWDGMGWDGAWDVYQVCVWEGFSVSQMLNVWSIYLQNWVV